MLTIIKFVQRHIQESHSIDDENMESHPGSSVEVDHGGDSVSKMTQKTEDWRIRWADLDRAWEAKDIMISRFEDRKRTRSYLHKYT